MSLRVVLYAEGVGETLGEKPLDRIDIPASGHSIPRDQLGPGHILLRRIIERELHTPGSAVRFDAPLRTANGLRAEGSMLLDKRVLRFVLVWPDPRIRPELAVVLVDADGQLDRVAKLRESVSGLPIHPTRVIAAAVQEFEAWLVADQSAAAAVLGSTFDQTPDPESMNRLEARATLDRWTSAIPDPVERRLKRREIAERCDLTVLSRRCPAFQRFTADIRSTAP